MYRVLCGIIAWYIISKHIIIVVETCSIMVLPYYLTLSLLSVLHYFLNIIDDTFEQ